MGKGEVQKEPPSHIFALLRNESAHRHKVWPRQRRNWQGAGRRDSEESGECAEIMEASFQVELCGRSAEAGVARTWSILAKLKFMNR